jgi:hypothetical protein
MTDNSNAWGIFGSRRHILKRNFILILILTVLLCSAAIPSFGQAGTTHKIPTAAQVAVQKKPLNRKGVMRGTTNTDRWKAATKHADQRAARIRAERKGVK